MSRPDVRPDLPELASTYVPVDTEDAIRDRWTRAGAFHVEADAPGDPYSIVIPPPNVTAALHLGHALNNTLQDVLIRHRRMKGDAALWIPGTDHAGIATQTVVEKRLLAQNTSRLEMGRTAFVEKVQEWKEEYEAVILAQLDEMGASCDRERTRFTMDEMCATAVRHAFFRLFSDGLIYRGKRLVNWDPATRTALADDEVEMVEVEGHMWYLRYPLTDGSGHLTVATTRPETMFGDTAVALNPDDPRWPDLKGRTVTLPIVGREIPIVADDHVVMADPDGDTKARIATGFLKVTPAHDPNDADIGRRHDLPAINVMAPDGSISDQHGWDDVVPDQTRPFIGLSREAARVAVVQHFDDAGLLERVEPYSHSVGHSYRSHVPIEPYLSDQWYVAVTDDRLSGAALRAMAPDQTRDLAEGSTASPDTPGDGELRFHPERYARTYQQWHEGIRDWCVSRQLWWGHQIPVWSRTIERSSADPVISAALEGAEVDQARPVEDSPWTRQGAAHLVRLLPEGLIEESICIPAQASLELAAGGGNPANSSDNPATSSDNPATSSDGPAADAESELIAAVEREGFERDADVLDTWFSSALWPMSTMGWPDPTRFDDTEGLLERFNPTSVLSTAREIITLWVSRMVMFNRYFLDGQVPFRDVFIHAMVQDGHGQKMSKSLGNGVDPRDIIHGHGADAMRFTLVQMTTSTQDVRMPVELICPHSGEVFTPEFITTEAGHTVAAPVQVSPADPSREMVSAYGVAVGAVEPSDERPLARNTSPKFDLGRNFANKLWNATRFATGVLDRTQLDAPETPIDMSQRPAADRWIVSRLCRAVAGVDAGLAEYHFNSVADMIYQTIWNDLCDWYLESVKPTIETDATQQAILGAGLDLALRMTHPICPFITEALWPHVQGARKGTIAGLDLPDSELITLAAWPTFEPGLIDKAAEATVERSQQLVGSIRQLRADRQVKPRQLVTLHLDPVTQILIAEADGLIQTSAGIGRVVPLTEGRPQVSSSLTFEGVEVVLSGLTDVVDLDAERKRLERELDSHRQKVSNLEGRLANSSYVDKAPAHLVQETRDQLEAAKADLAASESALAGLE